MDYDVKITFLAHLALLKAQYCFEKKFGMKVPTLLNEHKVDVGPSFSSWLCRQTLSKLWSLLWLAILSLSYAPIYLLMFVLKHWLFQYFKLVEVYVVMIPCRMEVEQCFSIEFCMKFKLRNKLTNHLDLVVKMFDHDQYSIDIFPFHDLIKA